MNARHCLLLAAVAALGQAPLTAAAADAAAPTPMEIKYDWATRETPATPVQGGACPIHVVATLDQRQNKETIGATFGGPLLTGEAGRWVSDGLLQLKNFGFTVDEVADAQPRSDGSLVVKTTLTRAYTWQIGLKIFSMVALKAEFIDRNGVLQQKHYRAHGDKTNMWGAQSEYLTTLNYGLNNLLPVVAQDLVALCKGNKVEAYTYAGPDPAVKK